MSWLETPGRRRVLFASLYLSEGAPIGFLWLALPTRMRQGGVPIERITWLTSLLVLPWAFKFLWAPLVDSLRSSRFTFRHWILVAQSGMALTLGGVLILDFRTEFSVLAGVLVLHAFAAATQDVAIDAWSISVTEPAERGRLNGWMQAGVLLGRSSMGGGALVLSSYLGNAAVGVLLLAITVGSMSLVIGSPEPSRLHSRKAGALREVTASLWAAALERDTWLALGVALLGGAAFKSLEVILGPFLVDRGYAPREIGWFTAVPMIAAMIAGALVGGTVADRVGPRRSTLIALLVLTALVTTFALADRLALGTRGAHLLVLLTLVAFAIGAFTAASYALFMDLTRPAIAATQFSAFMGATNGCESWSSYAVGRLSKDHGYSLALLAMCAASLLAAPLVWGLGRRRAIR